MIYHFHLLQETFGVIDWFILRVEAMYIYQLGKKEGKKTISCLGASVVGGGISWESTLARQSSALFVSPSRTATSLSDGRLLRLCKYSLLYMLRGMKEQQRFQIEY